MPDRELLNFPDITGWGTISTGQGGQSTATRYGLTGAAAAGNPALGIVQAVVLYLPTGQIIEVASNIAQSVASQTGATIGEFRTISGNAASRVYRNARSAVDAARRAMQSRAPVELPPPDTGFSFGGLLSDPVTLAACGLLLILLLMPRD